MQGKRQDNAQEEGGVSKKKKQRVSAPIPLGLARKKNSKRKGWAPRPELQGGSPKKDQELKLVSK